MRVSTQQRRILEVFLRLYGIPLQDLFKLANYARLGSYGLPELWHEKYEQYGKYGLEVWAGSMSWKYELEAWAGSKSREHEQGAWAGSMSRKHEKYGKYEKKEYLWRRSLTGDEITSTCCSNKLHLQTLRHEHSTICYKIIPRSSIRFICDQRRARILVW